MEAMRFLRAARVDPSLRESLAELDPVLGLEPVVEVAAAAGFLFGVEDLREAHAHDWVLRRARYVVDADDGHAAAADSAASTVAVVKTASSSM